MLKLEEHFHESITQIMHILVAQKFGLILRITRQISPREQILQSLSIFFDCEPHANQNQVVIVVKLFLLGLLGNNLCHIFSLRNWMTSTVNQLFSLLSQAVIWKEWGTDFWNLETCWKNVVVENTPLFKHSITNFSLWTQLKIAKNMLEKG